jgi:hypothetical protein
LLQLSQQPLDDEMQIPLVFSPKRAYIRDGYQFRLALTYIHTAATQYQFQKRPPVLRSEQNAYLGKRCELELLIGRNLQVAFSDIMFGESAAEACQGGMFTAVMKQHQTSSGNIFRTGLHNRWTLS